MNEVDYGNQENWEKLELDTAKFILEESEKFLSETIDTAKILTDRAVNIMQFSIPLSLALIGILSSKDINPLLYQISFIGLVAAIIVSSLCFKVYKLYQIRPLGNTPIGMINSKKMEFRGEQQLKVYLISAIHGIQISIEFNETANSERSRRIYRIEKWIQISAIIILGYAILWYPVSQFLSA